MQQNQRTQILIGSENLEKLTHKKVIVFGVGGVGSYVVEALVRMNIGHLTIVDFDIVDITNLNRQLIALHSTIGKKKVDVCLERIKDINPSIEVEALDLFIDKETIKQIDFTKYDYVIDAIDNVTGKLLIVEKCQTLNIPLISSLGTANKLDPSKLMITDISKTHTCPLAKVMRLELRKRDIKHLNVLFSSELPIKNNSSNNILGSVSYVPSSGGLLIASKVINDLINQN